MGSGFSWGTFKPPYGSQLDYSHPITRDLVLSWDGLDVGSQIASDANGNQFPGTLTGTVTAGRGLNGMGWQHDGSSSYIISRSDPDRLGRGTTKPFSHEVWFQVTTKPGALYFLTEVGQGFSSNTFDKSLQINSSGFLSTYVFSGTQNNNADNVDVTDGLFHHAVMTYDGATVFLYRDGALATSKAAASTFAESPANFFAPGKEATGSFFPGSVAIARAWVRTLGPSEVQLLYAQPFCMFAPPIYRRWFLPSNPTHALPALGVGT